MTKCDKVPFPTRRRFATSHLVLVGAKRQTRPSHHGAGGGWGRTTGGLFAIGPSITFGTIRSRISVDRDC
jgi:hypothetical protein